jgi:hypothetical protein
VARAFDRVNHGSITTHKEATMGSHHETQGKQNRVQQLIRLVTIALAVTAVVKEMRTPPADRTWHGVVARYVPYDLRAPTVARVRERMWSPESEHLINPRVFGIGWTLNAGRLVSLVRQKVSAAA